MERVIWLICWPLVCVVERELSSRRRIREFRAPREDKVIVIGSLIELGIWVGVAISL